MRAKERKVLPKNIECIILNGKRLKKKETKIIKLKNMPNRSEPIYERSA
ncbi:hypothetical protein [Fluviispira vulneris]|nr:hypothetical protein [Fluviispira vulneris]